MDPAVLVRQYAWRVAERYRAGNYTRLRLIAFGKAAPAMAAALVEELQSLVDDGIVVTTRGLQSVPLPACLQLFTAGHPLPDQAGEEAAGAVLSLCHEADARTLLVMLVSGGGSALLATPAQGLSLAQKQQTTRLLLQAGASIDELNTVRKHLSQIKGGRLAAAAAPAGVMALILSDVIGDPLEVIASGPTVPDPSTWSDALAVLHRYELVDRVPHAVSERLRRGMQGEIPDTPKAGAGWPTGIENLLIGSNRLALAAAAEAAAELGCSVTCQASPVDGEAREAGRRLARQALAASRGDFQGGRRHCLLSGGETTVTVRGEGRGGRNLELALAFALEIAGQPGLTLLSAGSDGVDGTADAAGAIVDGGTVPRAIALGLDPQAYLDDNDTFGFFSRAGGLFVTGPTGTNVMDLQILMICREP